MVRITIGQQSVNKSMGVMNAMQDDLDDYDILCLQEPYVYRKVGGLPKDVVAHFSPIRCRAAIVVVTKSIPVVEL